MRAALLAATGLPWSGSEFRMPRPEDWPSRAQLDICCGSVFEGKPSTMRWESKAPAAFSTDEGHHEGSEEEPAKEEYEEAGEEEGGEERGVPGQDSGRGYEPLSDEKAYSLPPGLAV